MYRDNRILRLLLIFALYPACRGTPPPSASSTSAPSAPALPKLGEACGDGDACGEGKCVTFYGIAGPRGPAFQQCEIKCDAKAPCPDGRTCTTIADGPGQVCR